jgi:hypothetical protein
LPPNELAKQASVTETAVAPVVDPKRPTQDPGPGTSSGTLYKRLKAVGQGAWERVRGDRGAPDWLAQAARLPLSGSVAWLEAVKTQRRNGQAATVSPRRSRLGMPFHHKVSERVATHIHCSPKIRRRNETARLACGTTTAPVINFAKQSVNARGEFALFQCLIKCPARGHAPHLTQRPAPAPRRSRRLSGRYHPV